MTWLFFATYVLGGWLFYILSEIIDELASRLGKGHEALTHPERIAGSTIWPVAAGAFLFFAIRDFEK